MASNLTTLFLVISALLLVVYSAQGQDMPPCATNLIGCAAYLNGTTKPPATCCGPLEDAAVNQTACLCSLLNNKELLKSFNVDPKQGLALAKRCNVTTDAATCAKASAPSSPTGGTTPTPTPVTPSSSNSTTGGKSANSAQKMNWKAVNGFMMLLFPFLWSIIF